MEIKEKVFVLMSKDRRIIAKGVPRNRCLCLVNGNDRKRTLTYKGRGVAESNSLGFYTGFDIKEEFPGYDWNVHKSIEEYIGLEPVECELTLKILS